MQDRWNDDNTLFQFSDDEMSLTIYDVEIEESENDEKFNRYMIRAKASNLGVTKAFIVYSEFTTNKFQKRKRGEKTERQNVVDRLNEQLHDMTIPKSVYSEVLAHLKDEE